eukprot:gene13473-44572_t
MAGAACVSGEWWQHVRDVAYVADGAPYPLTVGEAAVRELRAFAARWTPGRMPSEWELRKGGRPKLLRHAREVGWRLFAQQCGFTSYGAWDGEHRDLSAELRSHADEGARRRASRMPSGWALMCTPGRPPRARNAFKPGLRELARGAPG